MALLWCFFQDGGIARSRVWFGSRWKRRKRYWRASSMETRTASAAEMNLARFVDEEQRV
jgi:hypothetical protein